MPAYTLSKAAENDIASIADYTIEIFGIEQAISYRDGLIRCLRGASGITHPHLVIPAKAGNQSRQRSRQPQNTFPTHPQSAHDRRAL